MSYTTVTRSALHLMNYPTIQSSLSYFLVNRTRSPRVLALWVAFIHWFTGSLVHWFTQQARFAHVHRSIIWFKGASRLVTHKQHTHLHLPVIEQEPYRVYSSADT